MNETTKKELLVSLIVVVVAAAGFGVWYWQKVQSEQENTPTGNEEPIAPQPAGLGAELFDRSQNPLNEKMPETNPFANETNPMKDVYKNPFE